MPNEQYLASVTVALILNLWAGRGWSIHRAQDVHTIDEATRVLEGVVRQPAVAREVAERTWREWPQLRHAVEAVLRSAPRR